MLSCLVILDLIMELVYLVLENSDYDKGLRRIAEMHRRRQLVCDYAIGATLIQKTMAAIPCNA